MSRPSIPKSVKLGVLIGIALSLLRLRKLLRKHKKSIKHNDMKFREITIKLFKYFITYPLFTTTLSVALKQILKSHQTHNSSTITLSISTFIATFCIQTIFKAFSNEWALYLLCRAGYSYCKYKIPSDLQPRSIYLYPMIHCLCSLPLHYYSEYASDKLWFLIKNGAGEHRERWMNMVGIHHHKSMVPNCGKEVHETYPDSCWKSAINDIKDRFGVAFPYCFQLFLYSKLLLSINKILDKNVDKYQLFKKLLKSVLYDTYTSSMFFVIGIMCNTRSLCLMRWIFFDILRLKKDKFEYIGWNNMPFKTILCGLMGATGLWFSDEAKQTDITISVLWNALVNIWRVPANLKGSEDERYHPVLGSKYFTSLLVALSFSLLMIVYVKKPKALKSWERLVLHDYLLYDVQ